MMKNTLLALGLLTLSSLGHSAINLSYDGSFLPTSSSKPWSIGTASPTVTTELVADAGRQVLKLTDVGNATGNRFINIRTGLTVSEGDDLFSNDWEYTIVMKIPGLDQVNSEAWTVGANIFTSLVRDLGGDVRHMYALYFGRDANGNTQVKSGTSTQSAIKLLSGDVYHEYKVSYSKDTQVAKIFVNGEYWQDLLPNVTTGSSGYFTFGDNQNQSETRLDRWFYVDYVSLMTVPEPRRAMLVFLGLAAGLLRRKRTQHKAIESMVTN